MTFSLLSSLFLYSPTCLTTSAHLFFSFLHFLLHTDCWTWHSTACTHICTLTDTHTRNLESFFCTRRFPTSPLLSSSIVTRCIVYSLQFTVHNFLFLFFLHFFSFSSFH
ncbi:hypothetical protein K435DRAFT_380489 [Dendrothele bispora CBS 962.96]|uniref:Secreted protein n=1 Tax=Dendrothele bispora (strain CBS 962.96) TaxID=1314807 RepID=A0A4S8MUZ7_DENBC|nr:hypothetical protein K435DRAFT_380489 [Dendrothele bispora CBS 962.96]